MNTIKVPTMWTIQQAATETNIAVSHVRKLVAEKKISYIKTGKKYLINAESLCEYLTDCNNTLD